MVLDDHVEAMFGGELREPMQSIGRSFHLFVVGALRGGIHANGMTTQHPRCANPSVMVLDSLLPFGLVCGPQVPFAVDHNEQTDDTFVFTAGSQFGQVSFVIRFVLEK